MALYNEINTAVLEERRPPRHQHHRAVYTAQFDDAIYVLHAFQKKSTRGIATPKHD